MRILGFDTSSKFLPVVLFDKERIISSSLLDSFPRHSKGIIPAIQRTLKKAKVSVEDIDAVAVGLGPGSLTGIRVGMAVAKGMCFALSKPVFGICSLDIIAENVADEDVPICVMVDAKRSLFFSSVYRRKKGVLKRISALRLCSADELFSSLKPGTVFTGDGVALCAIRIQDSFGKNSLRADDLWYPAASGILRRVLSGVDKLRPDAEGLNPIYLYPKECQIK